MLSIFPTVTMYGEAVAAPIEHQNRFMDFAKNEINRLVGDASIDSQALVTLGNTTEEISRLVVDFNADYFW